MTKSIDVKVLVWKANTWDGGGYAWAVIKSETASHIPEDIGRGNCSTYGSAVAAATKCLSKYAKKRGRTKVGKCPCLPKNCPFA